MVMVSSKTHKKFPELTRLIKSEITGVPSNNKYWKALLTVLELDKQKVKPLSQISMAFAYGTYPIVKSLGLGIDTYGRFKPSTPDVVYVSSYHLKKFNQNPALGWRFMMVNVIHEMIHYFDLSIDGKLQADDPGDKFEELVFGKQIYPPW